MHHATSAVEESQNQFNIRGPRKSLEDPSIASKIVKNYGDLYQSQTISKTNEPTKEIESGTEVGERTP